MTGNSRFVTILHLSSFLVFLYSFSMLVPLFVGLLYEESNLMPFIETFAIAFSVGVLGWVLTRSGNKSLQTRDGFTVAVLFWVVFSAVSTMPFYLDDRLGMSLTDSLFESVSGITTTGASIMSDIDSKPRSVLYYRAQLNFLGGLGIIVLAIAVLPLLGIGGSKLYQSEMPGPLKEQKFTPRLADTAKHLWLIYLGMAIACALSYYLAGMDAFDAICHSLSTVSIGGFSPHDASIGYYNSHAIELVGGFFNILAAVNFALYFLVIHRRSLMPILKNPEFRFFITVLALLIGFTSVELYRVGTFNEPDSLVHGFFVAISIMTTNGLTAGDYPSWPPHIVVLLIGASFFGGCVGSTCGGLKAMRMLLLYKTGRHEKNQLIHPNATMTIKVGRHAVEGRVIRSVWGLFFLWMFFASLFIWILTALGYDLNTAFGTVAAGINNMGVGWGETAGGFGVLSDPAKWLMCVAMLFGRLEIFPLLIVFSKTFWRF